MNEGGRVVLDTSIVVAHFRNDPGIMARLQALEVIFVPWVVVGELHYGAARSARPDYQLALIREFLRAASLLLPDEKTASVYGMLKAELASSGKLIPENDIWIAAIAHQHGRPLMTRDHHFNSVAGLRTVAG